MAAAWQEALLLLAGQVNKPTYEAHFKTLRPVSISDSGKVCLQAPSDFTRGWIEKRHLPTIQGALSSALKREVAVELVALRGTL